MKISTFTTAALAILALCSCGPAHKNDTRTMNKDFMEIAAQRYSVRHFTSTPVEKEKIDMIIEAGRLAPTAVNSQPQMVVVIQSPEKMEKLNKLSPCVYGAPHAFLFCYNKDTVCPRGDSDNYGDIDVTIVLTHMMLEAANLGVGTCPVGYFDSANIVKELGLTENLVPVLLMPFGYAAEDAVPSPRHTEYRPVEETVAYI